MKQECSFWDFKQNWYSDSKIGDLLHDIICMANNLENRDAYIIIGVDEENYKLVDVTNDSNRKNTQNIHEILLSLNIIDEICWGVIRLWTLCYTLSVY